MRLLETSLYIRSIFEMLTTSRMRYCLHYVPLYLIHERSSTSTVPACVLENAVGWKMLIRHDTVHPMTKTFVKEAVMCVGHELYSIFQLCRLKPDV
jgi:hypothetical protein